jgi:cell division protease FtsH
MGRPFKLTLLWLSLLAVIFLAWHFAQIQDRTPKVSFDELLNRVEKGDIEFVSISLRASGPAATFCAYFSDDHCVRADGMLTDGVLERFRTSGVSFSFASAEAEPAWANLLVSWAPFLLLIGFWVFFMRQMKGGGGVNLVDMKKAVVSRLDQEPRPTGTLAASSNPALEELRSLTSGAPRPGRALLVGPSGCGKSFLLQTLFAGSSRPCLVATSPSFVDTFVGVGAARVRDLMTRAHKDKVAAVVLDGIDELCPRRAAASRPERDERVQAAHQLAASMDELSQKPTFAFIAVTNRPDLLDEAVMRRFDRVVTVAVMDAASREALLGELLSDAQGIDVRSLAAETDGWLPGDLSALAADATRRAAGGAASAADVEAALRARAEIRARVRQASDQQHG